MGESRPGDRRIPWHLLLPRSGTILFIEKGEKTMTAVLDGEFLARGTAIGREKETGCAGRGGERPGGQDPHEAALFDTVVYLVRDSTRRQDRKAIQTGLKTALARVHDRGRLVLVVENSSPWGMGPWLLFAKCRRFLRRNGAERLRSLRLYRGSVQEWYGISGGNWRAVNYYLQELTTAGSWHRVKGFLNNLAARLHLHRWEVEHRILMVGKARQ